jgi:hypothetical protein
MPKRRVFPRVWSARRRRADRETIAEFAVRDPDPGQAHSVPEVAIEFSQPACAVPSRNWGRRHRDRGSSAAVSAVRAEAKPPPLPPMRSGAPALVMDREALLRPIDYGRYETITDMAALDRWMRGGPRSGCSRVSLATDSADPMRARLIGIALALRPARPDTSRWRTSLRANSIFRAAPAQLSEREALSKLSPLCRTTAF